jgi:hypothetical protein
MFGLAEVYRHRSCPAPHSLIAQLSWMSRSLSTSGRCTAMVMAFQITFGTGVVHERNLSISFPITIRGSRKTEVTNNFTDILLLTFHNFLVFVLTADLISIEHKLEIIRKELIRRFCTQC